MANKKALIDLEFLVNLIRGLLVLVVIFFVVGVVYKVFMQDNDQEQVKAGLMSMIETLRNIPPGYGPMMYSLNLGGPDEYYIRNSRSLGFSVEPEKCNQHDCLCLFEGEEIGPENPPLVCEDVVSNVENALLDFYQYKWDGKKGVSLHTTEYHEDTQQFPEILIKRTENDVALCQQDGCDMGHYCACLAGIDEKTSAKTIDNLNKAVKTCRLNTKSNIDQELMEKANKAYESSPQKDQIFYSDAVDSNQDIKLRVYELVNGIHNIKNEVILNAANQAPSYQWSYYDKGVSQNMIGLFEYKMFYADSEEHFNNHVILCTQIDEDNTGDFTTWIDGTNSVEVGYCIDMNAQDSNSLGTDAQQNNEPLLWSDVKNQVSQMISEGKANGDYYYEFAPAESSVDESANDENIADDGSGSDEYMGTGTEAGIADVTSGDNQVVSGTAGSSNEFMHELIVKYNIKPYFRIKSNKHVIYSTIIKPQPAHPNYITESFDVQLVKAHKFESSGRAFAVFAPHIISDDNSNAFLNMFSLSDKNPVPVYDQQDEVNQASKEIIYKLLGNDIQASIKQKKISCNEKVLNTLVHTAKEAYIGWIIRIKSSEAWLEYNGEGKEEVAQFTKIGKSKYPVEKIDCIIDANGNYDSQPTEIIITPADKDISIVKIDATNEVCLLKGSVMINVK